MLKRNLEVAVRRTAARPMTSAVAILTLAVGIGVSAAIFTLVQSVLLEPLPFHQQEELALITSSDPPKEVPRLELTFDEIEMIRKQSKTLVDIAGMSAANFPAVILHGKRPIQLQANIVGEPFFRVLGIRPVAGRTFTRDEHALDAPLAAMISHEFFQSQFGGDESIVGQNVFSDGTPITIIGVLPAHMDLPNGADLITPLEPAVGADENSRANRVLFAVARLRPGVGFEQAEAELKTIARQMELAHPDTHAGITSEVYPLADEMLGTTKPAIKVMFAMAMLVLLIAAFNVANMFLTQGIGRQREFAIRAAMGADRRRLITQLLAEAAVIAGVSALLGFAIAQIALKTLISFAPPTLPRIAEVHIGGPTFLFVFLVAAITALVFALVPAYRASRIDVTTALREGSSQSTISRGTRRMLDTLAVIQIAVALILLVTSALIIQSFLRMSRIDVGFSTKNVITAHLPLGYTFTPDVEAKRQFFDQLFERIRALPGVESAGSVLMRPLEMELGWDFTFTAEGQDVARQESNPMANFLAATPGYFEAMGIRLLEGRTFTDADDANAPKVMVVSESFARRYWGVKEVIGRRIKSGAPDSEKEWLTIVGVVSDVRYRGLTTEKLDVYAPAVQTNWSPNYLAVRTAGSPEPVIAALHQLVRELKPEVPLSMVQTTEELVDAKLAQPRLNALIVGLFAATALFLALVGLYGVLSYSVRQRSSEMGVRVALGAERRDLLKLVIGEALKIAVLGSLIGVLVAYIASRFVGTLLYGVTPSNPALFLTLGTALTLASVMASLLPALRAARVDPVQVLRAE